MNRAFLSSIAKNAWSNYTPEERKKRIDKVARGLKRYCADNRKEVLKRARDNRRRANVSAGLRKAYLEGRREVSSSVGKGFSKCGWYISTKSGISYWYRSGWEKDFMVMLDKSSAVEEWGGEGSAKLPYVYRGKKHMYFIDFMIGFCDGIVWTVELKPKSQLETPINLAKANAARKSEVFGRGYKIVSDINEFQRKFL